MHPVCVLLLAAASLLGAAAVRAQTPTVIRALPYTINSPGTYVLDTDFNSTQTYGYLITVNANHVTIDFQGHYIAGPTNNQRPLLDGIYAYEQSDLTIKNGTIAYCYSGVFINGNNSATTNNLNARIEHMRATHCAYAGFALSACRGATVTDCQVTAGGYQGAGSTVGIEVAGAGMTVTDNVVSNIVGTPSCGIRLGGGCFARGNTISGCDTGINGGKYQNNLVSGASVPFTGGVDAGGNL